MSARAMKLLIGALGVALAAAACGDDSGGSGADAPPFDAALFSTDGSGGGACSADPAPPGAAACPAECTGGCAGNVCTIDCRTHNCESDTITCPADYACLVDCYGVDNCDSATINCPAAYACTVTCGGGIDSCGDQNLICGNASCRMECDGDSCVGASITCGAGACTAACTAGATPPGSTCGSSCSCAGCP